MSFYTDAVMADSPVAYWRLGESAGTIAHDATANGLNATYSATGVTKGIVGPLSDGTFGVSLDGVAGSADVTFSSLLNPSTAWSVEAWFFETASQAANNPILDCRPASSGALAAGFDLFLTASSSIGISVCSANVTQTIITGSVTLSTWHHAVATYDGASVRLYVDGALVAGPTACPYTPNPTKTTAMGHLTGGGNFLSATIDEVAIYPTALSAARVLAHYQAASIAATGAGTLAPPVSPYTYRVADLMTGNMLAELPLKSVSYGAKLNDSGSFSAELPMSDPKLVLPKDPIGSTQPGRTAIWIDRAGVLVWGGILWTRKYNSSREVLSLGAQDFLSYFDHRYITDTLSYTNVDQLSLAQQLIQNVLGKSGSWSALQYVSPYPTSPILRTQAYNSYEFKQASQALQDLSQADNGFDFGFDVGYASGVPVVTFNPAYPRRGRNFNASGFVLELPGGVIDYDYSEDGTQIAITDHVVGSGAGTSQLTSSSSTPSLLDAGYPLIEGVFSYKGQTDQATLDQVAMAEAKAYAGPVATFDLTALGSYLSPGSFISGDDIRLRITDKRFNLGRNADGSLVGPGLDAFKRIFSYEVTPGDDTAETVKFTLGAVPA